MPNIVLTRIDNRLVHGQVGMTWAKYLKSNLIVVCDDKVADDPIQQDLMSITAETAGVGIRFFSIEKTISAIHDATPSQWIFIVCRTPKEVLLLIKGGVPIDKVNVGNMLFSLGKKQISSKVYVDDEDLQSLLELQYLGLDVSIQDIPTDSKTALPNSL